MCHILKKKREVSWKRMNIGYGMYVIYRTRIETKKMTKGQFSHYTKSFNDGRIKTVQTEE